MRPRVPSAVADGCLSRDGHISVRREAGPVDTGQGAFLELLACEILRRLQLNIGKMVDGLWTGGKRNLFHNRSRSPFRLGGASDTLLRVTTIYGHYSRASTRQLPMCQDF